jgi:hypothetical protein
MRLEIGAIQDKNFIRRGGFIALDNSAELGSRRSCSRGGLVIPFTPGDIVYLDIISRVLEVIVRF